MHAPAPPAFALSFLAALFPPILRPTQRPIPVPLQLPAVQSPQPSLFHSWLPPHQLASDLMAQRNFAQLSLPRNPSTRIPLFFRRHRTPARIAHKKHT